MYGHEDQGIGKRSETWIAYHAAKQVEGKLLDAEGSEDDGKCLAHHVEEQGVHAKGKEELGYPGVALGLGGGGEFSCCRLLVNKLDRKSVV